MEALQRIDARAASLEATMQRVDARTVSLETTLNEVAVATAAIIVRQRELRDGLRIVEHDVKGIALCVVSN